MDLQRTEGWEKRLAEAVEAARTSPYRLGEHDCFQFACSVVYALTGVDFWPDWRGKYSTRQESLMLLAKYAGGFTSSFTKLFGVDPEGVLLARRGDILEYVDVDHHLGVCVGEHVAVLGEEGLAFVPLRDCKHVWRIG